MSDFRMHYGMTSSSKDLWWLISDAQHLEVIENISSVWHPIHWPPFFHWTPLQIMKCLHFPLLIIYFCICSWFNQNRNTLYVLRVNILKPVSLPDYSPLVWHLLPVKPSAHSQVSPSVAQVPPFSQGSASLQAIRGQYNIIIQNNLI